MRKTYYIIAITFFLLFCCSCSREYKFIHSIDEINNIEIIEISEKETVVKKVLSDEERSEFIIDFRKIKCFSYFNDPSSPAVGTAIKINYSNGDYEIISREDQDIYKNKRLLTGMSYFDSEEFDNLIKKYLES